MDLSTLIVAMGVPSAITGFCFWMVERRMERREKEQKKKESAREQNEILVLESINAAIALGEATAIAIKNGHTNGETEEALEYARKVKHDQKDFLRKQAIDSIY